MSLENISHIAFDKDAFKNLSAFEPNELKLGQSVKIVIKGYWDDSMNYPPRCNCGYWIERRASIGILEYVSHYLWKCRDCGAWWRLW